VSVPRDGGRPEFGLDRGKIFPAEHAGSLLNPARHLVQSPRRTVAAVGVSEGARVLELGCGPGFFSPYIAEAAASGHVVLVDLQAEMLQMARERLNPRSLVSYVQADGSALPLPDGSFDVVFISTVLGEIPDRGACLAHARRVLRLDGTLAIAETRRDSDFIAPRPLQRLVEPYGFRMVARRGLRCPSIARFNPT
jgi:ubiquinone/menaquinone biosynthesis C-methylase UbiE